MENPGCQIFSTIRNLYLVFIHYLSLVLQTKLQFYYLLFYNFYKIIIISLIISYYQFLLLSLLLSILLSLILQFFYLLFYRRNCKPTSRLPCDSRVLPSAGGSRGAPGGHAGGRQQNSCHQHARVKRRRGTYPTFSPPR